MDIISFNEAATANGRIEKFNANPDSNSGIVTQPRVIEAGESVTIPSGRMAILPNIQVDGEIVLEAGAEIFIPAGADDRIGLIDYGYVAKSYHIVAFGGEFNRADYPKLWEYIQGKSFLKSDAEWQDEATANDGVCGFYSDGNGTTTFRVPNLDKAFLRPDSRSVGSFQGDAIRNITGSTRPFYTSSIVNNTGAFSSVKFGDLPASYEAQGTDPGYNAQIGFNASIVVPTANENRPKNIAVLPLIVAK